MSGKMKFMKTIKVTDDVELEVYELPGGEHVGIEAWFLDQLDTSEIQDPYNPGVTYPVPPVPKDTRHSDAPVLKGEKLTCPQCQRNQDLWANQHTPVRIPVHIEENGGWEWNRGDLDWKMIDEGADWDSDSPKWYCQDCDLEFNAPEALSATEMEEKKGA